MQVKETQESIKQVVSNKKLIRSIEKQCRGRVPIVNRFTNEDTFQELMDLRD